MIQKKTISIITPCYNEEANVLNLYNQVRAVMVSIARYEYEHIFIDNHSRDNTVAILRMIAAEDPNVKVIVNARNFGTSAPSTPSCRPAATPSWALWPISRTRRP